MKLKPLMIGCLMVLSACTNNEKDACLDLRIGMTKMDVERVGGRPDYIKKAPEDLYRGVTVFYYKNKGAFADRDIVHIADREDEVISISCQEKSIYLRQDGKVVEENHAQRWRIDMNPSLQNKASVPQ